MSIKLNSYMPSSVKIIMLVAIFVLLLSGNGWSEMATLASLDPTKVKAELRAFEAAHEAAIEAKDIEATLQFYAPDLITIPSGEPILRGRDWIRSALEVIFGTYEFNETFTLSDIRIFGDRVAATFQYTQRMTPLKGGSTVIETGKGLCILKRSKEGKWQWEWNAYGPDANEPEPTARSSIHLIQSTHLEEGRINVNGAELYYKIMGSGEPIVILHGGPGLEHTYFLPQMGELAKNYKLIFYDQRTSGGSISSTDSSSITLDNFVQDLEAIRNAFDLDKMNLLGHSWGGMLAMFYGIKYPENLNSLMLIGSGGARSEFWNDVFKNNNIDNSEFVPVEKCGHFPYIETPTKFFSLIRDFMGNMSKK